MKIKAVMFDMGDTLIKYDCDSSEEVFQRILISLGFSKSLDETKIAVLNSEIEAMDIGLISSFGKIKREEYRHRWNSLVLKHLKMAEDEELARIVQSRWFDFVDSTLYPEVKGVLSELKKRGLKLGLVSNSYEEEITCILERADLERETFDIIVGVDTIWKAKPNPNIFRYAIRKLKLNPEETIFIGDDVEADYKGAENAGLHALLIDRTGKQSGLRTIKNLKEILSQID